MPSSSVTLDQPNPSFGDTVTFTVATDQTDFPWLEVTCEQNREVVFDQIVGYFPSYCCPQTFTLGPTQLWASGAAEAAATLWSYDRNGRGKKLAVIHFNVAA